MFDPGLLEILECPKARAPLVWDKDRNVLISAQAGVFYRVVDGVAVLLPELAQPLSALDA
ncbi:Trm112 family protein [Ramlibacter sp.]|uniref:Trm112 family protein n=1 Tax=Ramlibacter sp. TaxID=1917967 RepID=UPI00179FA00D|nr:Trm112 family protein [Ramlibacter sp.]MBA2672840.1 Trm112 family protein [Ramlibacter sp.]